MNPIQAAFAPQARGIDFIAAAAGLTAADLVALGVPDTFAARIVALYETYFGRTRYSRDQRTARAAAHSFAVLEVIERHARTVPSVKLRWQLRARLATLRLDARAMGRAAARVVRELKSPAPPAPGITRARHAGGMGTMKITADEALIADLFTLVDPQRPVESFAENIRGGTGGFRVLTHAVMSLDEAIAIERGQGPTRVRLTNGAVIDLREFLQRRLDGEGLVTVVSEREGLVDQYRLSRGGRMASSVTCSRLFSARVASRGVAARPMNARSITSSRGHRAVRPTSTTWPCCARITTAPTTTTRTPHPDTGESFGSDCASDGNRPTADPSSSTPARRLGTTAWIATPSCPGSRRCRCPGGGPARS